MSKVEHAEGGTVLQPEDVALVIKNDGSVELLIPNADDDADTPEHVLLLTALLLRLDDPDWRAEFLAWIKEQVTD